MNQSDDYTDIAQNGTLSELAQPHSPDGLFQTEHSIPHAFSVLSNRVSRTLQKMYSERFGLSVVGWRLLGILGTHAPLSAKTLSEITAMDQVSISRALELLVGKKLVSRRVDAADRRRVELRLTRTGKQVYDEIVPVLQAIENALVSYLSPTEAGELRSMMKRLLAGSADLLAEDCDWTAILARYGSPQKASADGPWDDLQDTDSEPPAMR